MKVYVFDSEVLGDVPSAFLSLDAAEAFFGDNDEEGPPSFDEIPLDVSYGRIREVESSEYVGWWYEVVK